jgi:predicted lactoylglutathione lyase
MSTKLFVNLPVKDLPKSKAFFKALGFDFNPQFTDDNAACLVISEHNYAMLITHPMFQGFTPGKAICDAQTTTEVLIALTCETRAKVDEMVASAVQAGGAAHGTPKDYGFMYQHGFQDLDGHIWEPLYMDPSAVQ